MDGRSTPIGSGIKRPLDLNFLLLLTGELTISRCFLADWRVERNRSRGPIFTKTTMEPALEGIGDASTPIAAHHPRSKVKRIILHYVMPWLITGVAFYFAFRGIEWSALLSHLGRAHWGWLALGVLLTGSSYFARARRWQSLFPRPTLGFLDSMKVLVLGFFMNNVLPARAGEFVRAHLGAKVSSQTRTLVLATIASERLVDGLTLSIVFVIFSLRLGDQAVSANLTYVAEAFGAVALGVIVTLIFREPLFAFAEKIHLKFESKASHYTFNRLQVFVEGLSPLCTWSKLPVIIFWSIIIWTIELLVYWSVGQAFEASLALPYCVLFLVSVNFSSLIPAAPAGLGVIEAVASGVLVSIGIEREHALSMVIAQHLTQYLVVGIPGAIILLMSRSTFRQIQRAQADELE